MFEYIEARRCFKEQSRSIVKCPRQSFTTLTRTCKNVHRDAASLVQTNQADADTKSQRQPSNRLSLEQLPDVVLGKIVSHLHWKEKEWLQQAFPSLGRIMESPLAWEHFENDRHYAVEKLYMFNSFHSLIESELAVIQKYGKYFQSCTLWIHNVTVSEFGRGNNDFQLLRAVSQFCNRLKMLVLVHTSKISFSMIRARRSFYLPTLLSLIRKRGKNFRLSLHRLFYLSTDSCQSGILGYLLLLKEHGVLHYLRSLDFSHGQYREHYTKCRVPELQLCTSLQTLKCPVQSLTTSDVISLGNVHLEHLYLVNDDQSQTICFSEKSVLDWNLISSALRQTKRCLLKVHYIFKNRAVSEEDLNPNPFLRSLIFDNLSSSISAVMLRHIGDSYGQTLTTLAFCNNCWQCLMHFENVSQISDSLKHLALKCVRLHSFLSCLTLSSTALLNLVQNSDSLGTVRVYKENVRLSRNDKPEVLFRKKMAAGLGITSWDMAIKGENIFILPNVDCHFAFASCFNDF